MIDTHSLDVCSMPQPSVLPTPYSTLQTRSDLSALLNPHIILRSTHYLPILQTPSNMEVEGEVGGRNPYRITSQANSVPFPRSLDKKGGLERNQLGLRMPQNLIIAPPTSPVLRTVIMHCLAKGGLCMYVRREGTKYIKEGGDILNEVYFPPFLTTCFYLHTADYALVCACGHWIHIFFLPS